MTDPTGHREGWVGRNEEHSCNGLFPYRQDLKFPVQHFTRRLIHLAYSRAELGRVYSSISGIRHPPQWSLVWNAWPTKVNGAPRHRDHYLQIYLEVTKLSRWHSLWALICGTSITKPKPTYFTTIKTQLWSKFEPNYVEIHNTTYT